jgi:hypothetical protein
MDPLSNPVKRRAGGDRRSPQAKADAARREEQIVALRLRHISFAAIARQVGISEASARRTFDKALARYTDQDLQTYHRSEIAELAAEHAWLWRLVDAKAAPQVVIGSVNAMNRIHILRVKLLGLAAPQKLDIREMYGTGADAASADRLQRELVLDAVPLDEQESMYEVLTTARQRVVAASIETTGTAVTNATKSRKPTHPKDDEE